MGVREKGGQGYQPILSSFFAAIEEIGIGLVPILLEKPSFCPFGLSIPKSNLNPDIWPRPTKVKGSFYSELACTFTLTNLLKKNQPWHWTRERQEAFEDLKGAIMADLVLALPSCSLLLTYETSHPFYLIKALYVCPGFPYQDEMTGQRRVIHWLFTEERRDWLHAYSQEGHQWNSSFIAWRIAFLSMLLLSFPRNSRSAFLSFHQERHLWTSASTSSRGTMDQDFWFPFDFQLRSLLLLEGYGFLSPGYRFIGSATLSIKAITPLIHTHSAPLTPERKLAHLSDWIRS